MKAPLKTKENSRKTIVHWYECPACGEESDEYVSSYKGDTYECMCGAELEIV